MMWSILLMQWVWWLQRTTILIKGWSPTCNPATTRIFFLIRYVQSEFHVEVRVLGSQVFVSKNGTLVFFCGRIFTVDLASHDCDDHIHWRCCRSIEIEMLSNSQYLPRYCALCRGVIVSWKNCAAQHYAAAILEDSVYCCYCSRTGSILCWTSCCLCLLQAGSIKRSALVVGESWESLAGR